MIEKNSDQLGVSLSLCSTNQKHSQDYSPNFIFIVTYQPDPIHSQFQILAKEKIGCQSSLKKSFSLSYVFQIKQILKCELYQDDVLISEIDYDLGELLFKKNIHFSFKKQLYDLFVLELQCEPISKQQYFYKMKWKGKKLMNTDSYFDFWDKSDPYLKILRVEGNSSIQVKRTKILMDNLNPDWPFIFIKPCQLHPRESSRFKIECWDWQESGKDNFIGSAYLEAYAFKESVKCPVEIQLQNTHAKKPGFLLLEEFSLTQKPQFMDYIQNELQLSFYIGIDFTASNGSSDKQNSLHFLPENKKNQYENVIEGIGNIILSYNKKKNVEMFGFGGHPCFTTLQSWIGKTSHCFSLNGESQISALEGIEEALKAYRKAVREVQFSGPTFFQPFIHHVINKSKNKAQDNIYSIVLIIADGNNQDFQETINQIIKNKDSPISFIIVGVGQEDFYLLESLNEDALQKDSKGIRCQRRILQFLSFRDVDFDGRLLSRKVLESIPTQIAQYYISREIIPKRSVNSTQLQKKTQKIAPFNEQNQLQKDIS